MTAAQQINSDYWKCPICRDIMDGQNEAGPVSITARCHHVFHERCIQQALQVRRSCPLCNLFDLRSIEIISNPSYAEECQKWKDDPERFSLVPENLKPPQLREIPRQREFDIFEYPDRMQEVREEFQQLQNSGDRSPETIQKLDQLAHEYQQLITQLGTRDLPARLDIVQNDYRQMQQDYRQIAHEYSQMAEELRNIGRDYREMAQELVRRGNDPNNPYNPQKMYRQYLDAEARKAQELQDQSQTPTNPSHSSQWTTVTPIIMLLFLIASLCYRFRHELYANFWNNRLVDKI